MFVRTYAGAIVGIDAAAVAVEVNIAGGGLGMYLVGLPDNAVKESEQRIRAAFENSGERMSGRKVVVSLAPADLRKEGASFDLPIAVGILAAMGRVDAGALGGTMFAGELSLDGTLKPVRGVLEVLRQPLEEKKITVSRAKYSVEYPANFTLVAAMNPCPCGYYNHPARECVCSPGSVHRYMSRISGPLMDRIDMHVEVTPVCAAELSAAAPGESSAAIRARVVRARELQAVRFRGAQGVHTNAMMNAAMLREYCRPDAASAALLERAMERLNLSARAYDRILKVARTIADLAGRDTVAAADVAEAINYRSLDRGNWGR